MPDNPMAAAGGAVKKVPKWAWIAGAGIGGGIIFYRVTHRGGTADTGAAGDVTAPGDYGQTTAPLGTVTSSQPLGYSDGYAGGLAPSAGGVQISDVTDLLTAFQQGQPPPTSASDLLNSILPFIGGGAPSSAATYDTPAPAAAAPAAPPPPPPPAPAKAACPAKYPFDSDRGCYQVYCAPKGGSRAAGRWHNYASGADQFIHGLPC